MKPGIDYEEDWGDSRKDTWDALRRERQLELLILREKRLLAEKEQSTPVNQLARHAMRIVGMFVVMYVIGFIVLAIWGYLETGR